MTFLRYSYREISKKYQNFLLLHQNNTCSFGSWTSYDYQLRSSLKVTCRRVKLTLKHGSVCSVGDGENMRRNLMTFDALISLHNLFGVDWKFFVGIDDDTEKSWVCLWESEMETWDEFNGRQLSFELCEVSAGTFQRSQIAFEEFITNLALILIAR